MASVPEQLGVLEHRVGLQRVRLEANRAGLLVHRDLEPGRRADEALGVPVLAQSLNDITVNFLAATGTYLSKVLEVGFLRVRQVVIEVVLIGQDFSCSCTTEIVAVPK